MHKLTDFIASCLLQIKAVKLQPKNPFSWVNGWTSPVYFDSRKLLSYPRVRNIIKVEMARLMMEQFPEVEVVASIATNAIAMGALVADTLSLPLVYVHPEPKDHGFENRIEGDLRPRQKVVIIEDQISLGQNCIKVADALRKNGCQILGLVTIFDYELPLTNKLFDKNELPVFTLSTFEATIHRALETGYITSEDEKILANWQQQPDKWGKK
mgnify:CR=1 FL=1